MNAVMIRGISAEVMEDWHYNQIDALVKFGMAETEFEYDRSQSTLEKYQYYRHRYVIFASLIRNAVGPDDEYRQHIWHTLEHLLERNEARFRDQLARHRNFWNIP
ncbi:unnamed protein product [Caenorhabditis sp. 36 PRJEB53466]|nr:unnamed protein product [Caenorhabditis sp. 36 PRJEB53466]